MQTCPSENNFLFTTPLANSVSTWQQILRNNFTQWEKLANFLELSCEQRKEIETKPKFTLNLPLRLAEKIEKGTLDDPILKQFLPTKKEQLTHPNFNCDPVGDSSARTADKLLKKYEERALLLCTSACAMHCRFCFRQNFDYDRVDKIFEKELECIQQDTTLQEIILSGGDPLSLNNYQLGSLLHKLSLIPHIQRIRFHSRFPIGIPERIDSGLLQLFQNSRCQIFFVLHCNHPRELDSEVLFSLKQLRKQGAVLLNQSVLLQGVNDNLKTLKELFETLVNQGIIPYYLHQLDPVLGTTHFEVNPERGRELMHALTQKLSGYALPKYVKEIPNAPSKVALFI